MDEVALGSGRGITSYSRSASQPASQTVKCVDEGEIIIFDKITSNLPRRFQLHPSHLTADRFFMYDPTSHADACFHVFCLDAQ